MAILSVSSSVHFIHALSRDEITHIIRHQTVFIVSQSDYCCILISHPSDENKTKLQDSRSSREKSNLLCHNNIKTCQFKSTTININAKAVTAIQTSLLYDLKVC